MNRSKRHTHPIKSRKLSPKKTFGPTLKLVSKGVPEEELEISDKEEIANLGGDTDTSNPNFQSELNYDGYRTIEEYDNDVYNRDIERKENSEGDLEFDDRKELDTGEENLIDTQENKK